MTDKLDIINNYKNLCELARKKLSRDEYRELTDRYSSGLIENIWGSWTNFVDSVAISSITTRHLITKEINKAKVVVSYVTDGAKIDYEALNILKRYCKENKAELCILWGKAFDKKSIFSQEDYALLKPYLATEFKIKDQRITIKDFFIPASQKNPLMNLERIYKNSDIIVVGSNKQYLKMLPYKQYDTPKCVCSTGSLSKLDYKETVAGYIDNQNHTQGGILLEKINNKYCVRNLSIKENVLFDLNKCYSLNKTTSVKNTPAMVLGDLHLPDEDSDALKETTKQIQKLKPENIMLHDIASWHSVSHHDSTNYLTKIKNTEKHNASLQTEFEEVVSKLAFFTGALVKTQFNIVMSNHDSFINKWLDKGDFIKDSVNARFGAELFVKYLDNKNILSDRLPSNVKILPTNTSFMINGFELNEHGDSGISGAKGSITGLNKGFDKIIIGHTHSPEIFEGVVSVGTLSKLKMCYNQKGLTRWAHCNAVIHRNGTFQLLFI